VGRALLDAARAEAAARGLHPALDVVETNGDAIRLYQGRGWRRVRSEAWVAAEDGKTLLHYYVARQNQARARRGAHRALETLLSRPAPICSCQEQ